MSGERTSAGLGGHSPHGPLADEPGPSISGERTLAGGAAAAANDLMRGGLRVGRDSRYELVDKLGEGGMGSVWRAKDLQLGREVAIKRIRGVAGPVLQERFVRETRALTGLSHPNVVTVFDAGEDSYGNYLVMELVSGRPLSQRLREGALGVSEAVELFCAMCRGMSHAHKRGVVHRDLKPSNVMLNDDGVARILDFGLVRVEGSGDLSLSGVGMGTLDYASPEQKQDASRADERSDVFSLGLVFYELLTGKRPSPMHLHKVARPWRDILEKATEYDAEDRYESVDVLLDAVESAQGALQHEVAISRALGSEDDLRCHKCGLLNTLEAKFCRSCSESLRAPCPACETPIRTGLRRCDQCTADVGIVREILAGLATAKSQLDAGETAKAERMLKSLLKLSRNGSLGDGERYMSEVEALLRRGRASDSPGEVASSEPAPHAMASRSRRRRRVSRSGGSGSGLIAALLASGVALVVWQATKSRGAPSSAETQAASAEPPMLRKPAPERPRKLDQDAPPAPTAKAKPAPVSEPQQGRGPDAGSGLEQRKSDGAPPPAVGATSDVDPSPPAPKPDPIPTDRLEMLSEILRPDVDPERRVGVLDAYEKAVFGSGAPLWVMRLRPWVLQPESVADADGVRALEDDVKALGAGSGADLRWHFPWLRAGKGHAHIELQWATLSAGVELGLADANPMAAEAARSLATWCERFIPTERDRRKMDAAVAKDMPSSMLSKDLADAMGGPASYAEFMAWSLNRIAQSLERGDRCSSQWRRESAQAYGDLIYWRYWEPGEGRREYVLRAADIWRATDPDDVVADLVWALAYASQEAPSDGFGKARAIMKKIEGRVQMDDARVQALRVDEVLMGLELDAKTWAADYRRTKADLVLMAYPERDRGMEATVERIKKDRDELERQRQGLAAEVRDLERRLKELEEELPGSRGGRRELLKKLIPDLRRKLADMRDRLRTLTGMVEEKDLKLRLWDRVIQLK